MRAPKDRNFHLRLAFRQPTFNARVATRTTAAMSKIQLQSGKRVSGSDIIARGHRKAKQATALLRRKPATLRPIAVFAIVAGIATFALVVISESPSPLARNFRDAQADGLPCSYCPEMAVVPAGSFTMGSNERDEEKPPHSVTIANPLAVGRYVVKFEEWDACVADAGCKTPPDDRGWGRRNRPVINVSLNDAMEYVAWLSHKTGRAYRLLSEAEFEYAARAGSTTRYPWGEEVGTGQANCDGCGSAWDNKRTAPTGSFKPNAFGLYDMHGNVWQWVDDAWHASHKGAHEDGSVRTGDETYPHVVRGGSWGNFPVSLGSSSRSRSDPADYSGNIGFRVARTIV